MSPQDHTRPTPHGRLAREGGASGTDRVLARLSRINPTGAFLAVLAFLLVGLFTPGAVGGGLLLVLAAGLGWLMARTWPVQPPRARALRLLILSLLVAVAGAKLWS